jgi:hypothetical protein
MQGAQVCPRYRLPVFIYAFPIMKIIVDPYKTRMHILPFTLPEKQNLSFLIVPWAGWYTSGGSGSGE